MIEAAEAEVEDERGEQPSIHEILADMEPSAPFPETRDEAPFSAADGTEEQPPAPTPLYAEPEPEPEVRAAAMEEPEPEPEEAAIHEAAIDEIQPDSPSSAAEPTDDFAPETSEDIDPGCRGGNVRNRRGCGLHATG